MTEELRTVCYMCSSECGMITRVEGDRVVEIRGDPEHPMTHGALCPKVFAAPELADAKDRIQTPLRRVGDRGEGDFEPISWEEALNEIAAKLVAHKEEVGPESLLVQFGEKPDHDLVYRFAAAYGTPNVLDHDSICDTNRREGFMYTYGPSHFRPLPDLNRPIHTSEGVRTAHDMRYLLLVGENPLEATRFLYLRDGIRDAVRAGMHLTVVDPFETATARLAKDWLAVKPGSDLALMLAILRFVVVEDRGYLDHDFIAHRTVGFDELSARLHASPWTPEWAAERTGLTAETIRRVAHQFGSTKPAAAMVGMNGVGHHTNGFLTTRAAAMLVAITGNLDVPGGLALAPQPELDTAAVHGVLPPDRREKHKDNFAGYPLACRGIKAKDPTDILEGVTLTHGRHAGTRYPIRSLFVIHGNPLVNAPASSRWREALTKRREDGEYLLDLVVFNDTQLNDTGLLADYVLPMASFLERQGVCRIYLNEPTISLRRPVIGLRGQSRTPLGWLKPLAEACARHGDPEMAGAIPYDSDDEWCDALMAPQGVTAAKLRESGGTQRGPARFYKYDSLDTPSGKVELRSGIIDQANAEFGTDYEPLIDYAPNKWSREHADFAELAERFPFQLITGRIYAHTGSATQNTESALKQKPEPPFLMNVDDARRLDLSDGDRAQVENPLGRSIEVVVKTTDRLPKGVVRATHGWGQKSRFLSKSRGRGYNVNELTDDTNWAPISGNAGFGDMMVRISRINRP